MKKMTQKQIVKEIVKQAGRKGIRTEQVKIQAMYKGVSCADRYLRWLQEKKEVYGFYNDSEDWKGDATKTWSIFKPEPIQQTLNINNS